MRYGCRIGRCAGEHAQASDVSGSLAMPNDAESGEQRTRCEVYSRVKVARTCCYGGPQVIGREGLVEDECSKHGHNRVARFGHADCIE